LLSLERKRKKKRVWRQLCECLSEAEANLLATDSQLLLQALLIADLKSELTLSPSGIVYLEFSRAQPPLLQAFPFPSTLGEVALHTFSGLLYLQFTSDVTLPLIQLSFPHTATFTSFPTPRLLGGCRHSCLLQLACLFTVP
jgi:hypothetical protein